MYRFNPQCRNSVTRNAVPMDGVKKAEEESAKLA